MLMTLDKVDLDKINVVVCTIWREGNYLEETLNSLALEHPLNADRPVSLVLGSPLSAYIDPYRQSGISIVEMGPSTWSWIESLALRHRATWNYYRCLTQPTGGSGGTLVIEDDIRFARGWLSRLTATLAALEEASIGDFALSLYCPADFPLTAYFRGQLYAEYPLGRFYGTQAVYYTAKTRRGFGAFLKNHGVVANQEPYDVLLWQYLSEVGLPLFATAPSLVQHKGEQSTGLGGWHEAPSFLEDVTGPLPETPRSEADTVPEKEKK